MIIRSSSIPIPWAPPSVCPSGHHKPLAVASQHKQSFDKKVLTRIVQKNSKEKLCLNKCSLAVQLGTLLAFAEQPALAVTGINHQEDLTWVLIQAGIVAFFYFLVMPPIIYNWLRTRWYVRGFFETYFQFMFVFLFFPGVLLWAPFINVRKRPRDPNMKYPWSKPEDPSKIRSYYLKYPFAKPEDYDYS